MTPLPPWKSSLVKRYFKLGHLTSFFPLPLLVGKMSLHMDFYFLKASLTNYTTSYSVIEGQTYAVLFLKEAWRAFITFNCSLGIWDGWRNIWVFNVNEFPLALETKGVKYWKRVSKNKTWRSTKSENQRWVNHLFLLTDISQCTICDFRFTPFWEKKIAASCHKDVVYVNLSKFCQASFLKIFHSPHQDCTRPLAL